MHPIVGQLVFAFCPTLNLVTSVQISNDNSAAEAGDLVKMKRGVRQRAATHEKGVGMRGEA
jgi:hypothetical protein